MEEIKGIILNGTQYGLEDETTLETANASLKLAESNANDITALESDVIGVKTSAETALNTANDAKTTAESALTTAENAKALVDEKQPQLIGRYGGIVISKDNPHFFTEEEMLGIFGKTNEELIGIFDYLVLMTVKRSDEDITSRILHIGSSAMVFYTTPIYAPAINFTREDGKLKVTTSSTTELRIYITALPCEFSNI